MARRRKLHPRRRSPRQRSDIAKRNAYITQYFTARKRRDALRFADAWREEYPGRPVPEHMEAYEVSEYGRAPTEEDLKLLLGD